MAGKKICVGALVFLVLCVLTPSSCPALPRVERTVLANKLTVLVFEDHSIPAVTLELLVSAGSWRDPGTANGLANLTARSLLIGTRNLTFEQINERLDFIGATLDADCGKDSARFGMQMLKKDLDSGFGLFVDILTAPAFHKEDVEREKDNIVGKLRTEEDDPVEVASRAFEKALFLNSPYGPQSEGTEESLAGISLDALTRFYSDFYRPNNSILVVGGDITPAEVQERLVPKLLQWGAAEIPEMRYTEGFAEGPATVRIDRPVTQATIIIGSPAIDRADKDYYAFAVMNHILGSGDLSSRLMAQIRVKSGLAYSVQSYLLARKHAGALGILIQTKDATAKEAIALAVAELERLQREPVSEAELEGAKKFLIGNFPLRYSSTQQDFAKFLARSEFYGLGTDYPEKYPSLIQAVTAQDILGVAKKYLKPHNHVLTIVADLGKAQVK
ncbi:MAG: pitrilysin family protein [Syntrophobacteraceae bacterium]